MKTYTIQTDEDTEKLIEWCAKEAGITTNAVFGNAFDLYVKALKADHVFFAKNGTPQKVNIKKQL